MKHNMLLLAVLAFTLVLTQAAFADLITVSNAKETDGLISITLKNDLIATYTNYKDYNTTVYRYYINGNEVFIIQNKSASITPQSKEKIVFLDASWPSTEYKILNVTFTDQNGQEYAPETIPIFANPGIEKISTDIPEVITNKKDFDMILKLKASGDSDIIGISAKTKNGKYLRVENKTIYSTLTRGQTKEFIFSLKQTGTSISDTIVSTTDNILINITYRYYGFTTFIELNESFTIINKLKLTNLVPNVTSGMQVPVEMEKGTAFNVSILSRNINLGSRNACNLNYTLTSDSNHVSIPIHSILPGIELVGTSIIESDPVVTFKASLSDSAPFGDITLTLLTTYKDCDIYLPLRQTVKKTISVVETAAAEQEPEPEPVVIDTTVIPPLPLPVATSEGIKEESPGKFYAIMGVVALVLLVLIIYVLEARSRYI